MNESEVECVITGVEMPTEAFPVVQENETPPLAAATSSCVEPMPEASASSEPSPDQVLANLQDQAGEWYCRVGYIENSLKETIKFLEHKRIPLSNAELERAKAFVRSVLQDFSLAATEVNRAYTASRSVTIDSDSLDDVSRQVSEAVMRISNVAWRVRQACYSLSTLAWRSWAPKKCRDVTSFIDWWAKQMGEPNAPAPKGLIWDEISAGVDISDSVGSPCENDRGDEGEQGKAASSFSSESP